LDKLEVGTEDAAPTTASVAPLKFKHEKEQIILEEKEPVKDPVKEPVKDPVKEPVKEQKEPVKEHEQKHEEREHHVGKKRQ
jgi:hypothetical protein